jgi:hypothetical protein
MSWKNGTYQNDYLRVEVTNKHIHNPGQWVMHCRELDWNCVFIGIPSYSTQNDAQKEALNKVKTHLGLMIESID